MSIFALCLDMIKIKAMVNKDKGISNFPQSLEFFG